MAFTDDGPTQGGTMHRRLVRVWAARFCFVGFRLPPKMIIATFRSMPLRLVTSHEVLTEETAPLRDSKLVALPILGGHRRFLADKRRFAGCNATVLGGDSCRGCGTRTRLTGPRVRVNPVGLLGLYRAVD